MFTLFKINVFCILQVCFFMKLVRLNVNCFLFKNKPAELTTELMVHRNLSCATLTNPVDLLRNYSLQGLHPYTCKRIQSPAERKGCVQRWGSTVLWK